MLGLGRAMGETIAVALVIGSSPTITANLFSSGDSLPSVIAFQWGEATSDVKRSALIAMGLTLFVITIVVNLVATAVVNRATKGCRGHSRGRRRSSDSTNRQRIVARRPARASPGRRQTKNARHDRADGALRAGRRVRARPGARHRLRQGLVDRGGNFPAWFTKDIQLAPRAAGPGMKAAIIGTLRHHLDGDDDRRPARHRRRDLPQRVRHGPACSHALLRFLTNVMAGVPSIVMGLFIYVFWVVPRGVDGLNGLSGALALACLMLPIVVRSSEEMLRLVPQNLRDASYALGASTSRTTLRVVLPKASPGVISGCLLAIARAAGETAPLIFTIGAAKATNWSVFHGTNTSLSMQIYGNAKESFVDGAGASMGSRADADRSWRSSSPSIARVLSAATVEDEVNDDRAHDRDLTSSHEEVVSAWLTMSGR